MSATEGHGTPEENHAIWIEAVASSYPVQHAAWLDKIRADARKAALEEAVQITSRVRDRYTAQLRRTT